MVPIDNVAYINCPQKKKLVKILIMIYVSFKSNHVGPNLGTTKDSKAKKNIYSNIITKKPKGTFVLNVIMKIVRFLFLKIKITTIILLPFQHHLEDFFGSFSHFSNKI